MYSQKRFLAVLLCIVMVLGMFGPSFTVFADGGKPTIVEVTPDTAAPDETVELIGENFTEGSIGIYKLPDTDFSRVSEIMGTMKDTADVTQEPERTITPIHTAKYAIAGVIPKDMRQGQYILWARNVSGLSNPLFANKTEVFYAFPNEINLAKSKEVTVIGKNLSYRNGTELSDGHVFLRNSTTNAFLQVPLKLVNQYEITFDIPDSVSAGAYDEIWVNNGHGGVFGWSKTSILIKSQSIPTTVYDITDATYKAVANDETDDTDAIQKAIDAANAAGGGIVRVPAGKFYVDKEIPAPNAKLTKLLVSNPFGATPPYSANREFDKVFDSNTTTFFDYDPTKGTESIGYVGFDMGAGNEQSVSVIRYYPRSGTGNPAKMVGGRFQGSNDGVNYEDLYVVTVAPAEAGAVVRVITGQETKKFRYFRYINPTSATCNIADMEFFTGTLNSSDTLTPPVKPEAQRPKLVLKANVILKGEGRDVSTIKYKNTGVIGGRDAGDGPEIINISGSNSGIEDIRIEGSESVDRGIVINSGLSDITIKNMSLHNYYPGMTKKTMFGGIMGDGGYQGITRLLIDNCTIESGGSFNINKMYNSKISNNLIQGREWTPASFSNSYQNIFVGNRIDGRTLDGKRGGSRGFNFNLHPTWGGFKPTAMNYIARNDTQYIGREVNPTNDGEILLFDALVDVDNTFTGTGDKILHYGNIGTATGKTATVKGMSWTANKLVDEYVLVVEGKGLGQYRKITSNTADTITVDKNWIIQPDATSRVAISRFFYKNIVANNMASNNKGNDMRMYGQCIGNIFDGNISTVGDGGSPTAANGGTGINAFDRNLTTFHPTYYNVIKNSSGTRQYISFTTNQKMQSPRSVASLGNIISNNTADSYSITAGGPNYFPVPKTNVLYNVIEKNISTSKAINLDSPIIGDTIVRNNQIAAVDKYGSYGKDTVFIENDVNIGSVATPTPKPIPTLPPVEPTPTPEGNAITLQHGVNNYYGVADASLRSDSGGVSNNNGLFSEFECTMYNGSVVDSKYALIRFDTSLIPADREITGATLSLYHSTTRNPSDTFKTVDVHKVTSQWYEGNGNPTNIDGVASTSAAPTTDGSIYGVTYKYRPTWETTEETTLDSVLTSYVTGSWYDFNITKAVQEWVADPTKNYGVVLLEDNPIAANGTRTFASSQYPNATLHPKLTIYYKGDPIVPPQESIPPADVTETAVVNDDGKAWITWKDPNDTDLFKIRVYMEGELVTEVDRNIQSAVITGLDNGKSYNFIIQTVDGCGNVSQGIRVKGMPKAPNTKFYKGINLNGSAVKINGNDWLSYTTAKIDNSLTVTVPGGTLTNLNSAIFPIPFDDSNYDLTHMLNTGITASAKPITLEQTVDNGDYRVYLWFMEDYQNFNRRFNLNVEGKRAATGIGREVKGEFKRYGPFDATVTDGKLTLDLINTYKDVSLQGIEIYQLDLQAPGEVTNVNAVGGNGNVAFTWTPPSDADYDHVNIICESVAGSVYSSVYKFMGSGVQSIVIEGLSGGETYSFRLQTVDTSGNQSEGVVVQATPLLDTVAPGEVTILEDSVIPGAGELKIRWRDPGDTDLNKIKITGVSGTTVDSVTGSVYVNSGVETFTLSGLTSGITYYLKIQTMDKAGNLSNGVIVKGTSADTIPPQEVSNVTVKEKDHKLVISWIDPADTDFTKVKISGVNGTSLQSVANTVYGAVYVNRGIQTVTLSGLTNDKIYELSIQTIDEAGNQSNGVHVSGTPEDNDSPGGVPSVVVTPQNNELNNAINEIKKGGTAEAIKDAVQKAIEKASTIPENSLKKTETTESVKVEVSKEAIEQQIKAVLDAINTITAELKTAKLDSVSNSISREITIKVPDTVKEEVKVTLPAESIRALADKGLDIFVVTNYVSFHIPSKAVNVEQASSAQVEISTKEMKNAAAKQYTDAAAAACTENEKFIPVSTVYDFIAALVTGSNTQKIEGFKENVEVELTYNAGTANEDKLGVYRYNPTTRGWDYAGGKVDKENNKITFKTGHFSVYAVMEHMKTFQDVNGHWAKNDIELMAARHIINGVNESSFSPDTNITRAEFAALVTRALELDTEKYRNAFGDVSEDRWYADIIQTAAINGLIEGDGKYFRPEDTITREEMTVLIMRAYNKIVGKAVNGGGTEKFEDKGEISTWAQESVEKAGTLGIIYGISAVKFAPKANATRAEAAVIIKRLLNSL